MSGLPAVSHRSSRTVSGVPAIPEVIEIMIAGRTATPSIPAPATGPSDAPFSGNGISLDLEGRGVVHRDVNARGIAASTPVPTIAPRSPLFTRMAISRFLDATVHHAVSNELLINKNLFENIAVGELLFEVASDMPALTNDIDFLVSTERDSALFTGFSRSARRAVDSMTTVLAATIDE